MDIREKIETGAYVPTTAYTPETRQAYREETSRLEAQFKADLLAELGITKHPKADALYRMAWDRGHSCGFSEVVSEAEELAELLG